MYVHILVNKGNMSELQERGGTAVFYLSTVNYLMAELQHHSDNTYTYLLSPVSGQTMTKQEVALFTFGSLSK